MRQAQDTRKEPDPQTQGRTEPDPQALDIPEARTELDAHRWALPGRDPQALAKCDTQARAWVWVRLVVMGMMVVAVAAWKLRQLTWTEADKLQQALTTVVEALLHGLKSQTKTLLQATLMTPANAADGAEHRSDLGPLCRALRPGPCLRALRCTYGLGCPHPRKQNGWVELMFGHSHL